MGGISLLHSPWSRLHQPLAGTLPYGARTFLIPFGTRSSGHLARFLSYRFTPQKSSGQCPHPARDWVAHLRSEYARVGPACGLRGGTARGGRAALAGVTPRKGRGATRSLALRGGSPCAPLVGSAHTRLAIGLRTFGQSTRAWGQPAACAEARLAEGEPCLRGSRLAKGEARRGTWRCGAVRPALHWWAVPTPGSVGSAHTHRAIGLRAFGQSTCAWGWPAACAEARLAKGEARRAVWRCGAVRPALHWLEVSAFGSAGHQACCMTSA